MSGIRQRAQRLLAPHGVQGGDLELRVAALEDALEDSRRLNERLSDVLDVVVELLVPATDRDDQRLKDTLARLGTLL